MKIAQIRDVIRTAAWVRRDLTGGTPEEFKRQNVGGRLAEQIAALKALVIPERFPAERLARDEQIGFCEDVIARWNKARGSVAVPVVHVEVTLQSVDGETVEHSEGTVSIEMPAPFVEFVNVGEAIEKARREPEPKMYTRGNGGPVLKVYDGGKKS